MNKIYVETKKEDFQEKAKNILDYNAKAFSQDERKPRLTKYLEKKGSLGNEKEFCNAIGNYKETYKAKRANEYPEKRKFFDLKQEILRDELFPVLQAMPKGGLFHVHSSAGLSYDRLLLLCTRWNAEQSNQALKIVVITWHDMPSVAKYTLMFKYQEQNVKNKGIMLTSREITKFLQSDDRAQKLKKALCIIEEIQDSGQVWKQFNMKYSRFNDLMVNQAFYERYLFEFFKECKEDYISYIELRTGLMTFENPPSQQQSNQQDTGVHLMRAMTQFDVTQYLAYKDNMVTVPNGELTADNIAFLLSICDMAKTAKVTVKVILTANRGVDPDTEGNKLKEKIDFAINIRNKTNYEHGISDKLDKIKDMVIGFDFVGQEDTGFATCAYQEILYEKIGEKTRLQYIPLYPHAGESNWKQAPSIRYGKITDKENQIPNIIAGCICSKFRIGHGLTMVQYPELIDAIWYGIENGGVSSQDDILLPAVEINPISNQLLKYQEDLRMHPVFELLKSGINCVMGNDDPLIFDNPGLSYDFWMLIMDSEITYDMIKQIVFTGYVFVELSKQKDGPKPEENEKLLDDAWNVFSLEWLNFLGNKRIKGFINKYTQT